MLHVYIADLTGLEDSYDEKLNTLHRSRVEKLDAYKIPADKIRGLGAGLLIEKGLEDYLQAINESKRGKEAQECELSAPYFISRDESGRFIIRYAYGPQGKPFFKDYPDIYFNLSHSGMLAVLAVSDMEVGIDVQEFRGFNERIAKRFYHEKEVKSMNAVCDAEKKEMLFYKVWSGKEAYIKYTGEGMRQELQSFYLDLSSDYIIDNSKAVAKYMEANIDYANYCCSVVSGTNTQKIDKIMKIVL